MVCWLVGELLKVAHKNSPPSLLLYSHYSPFYQFPSSTTKKQPRGGWLLWKCLLFHRIFNLLLLRFSGWWWLLEQWAFPPLFYVVISLQEGKVLKLKTERVKCEGESDWVLLLFWGFLTDGGQLVVSSSSFFPIISTLTISPSHSHLLPYDLLLILQQIMGFY